MKIIRGKAGYWHWCPGCNKEHPLPDGWQFNGNVERPTFLPSFLHYPTKVSCQCHYIITDGQIAFCGDSDHELAGQTVQMPEVDMGKLGWLAEVQS